MVLRFRSTGLGAFKPHRPPAKQREPTYAAGVEQGAWRRAGGDRLGMAGELAAWCYPHLAAGVVEHKHRVAIRRAAPRVAVRLGRDWKGVIWGPK